MQRREFLQSVSGATLIGSGAQAAASQAGPAAGTSNPQAASKIALTEQEYFEGPGFVFLVCHNNYVARRGGLQMMQYGEWLLVSELLVAGRRSSRPADRVLRRVVNRDQSTATVFGEITGWNLGYQLICRTDGERMFVTLKFDRALDWSNVQAAGFSMFLYPAAYFGKTFQGDSAAGVFPRQFDGERVLLKSTSLLRVAQDDPSCRITFERRGGTLELADERRGNPTQWFSVNARLEPGSADTEVNLEITPSIDPQWRRAPVIGVSQVGYHPRQPKRAVLELDPREDVGGKVSLYKMTQRGDRELVKSEYPKPWGRFLYYKRAIFDFSEVVEPGAYVLECRGQTAGPFLIDAKVYDKAWQPTLEVFLPVQMCHVAVRDTSRYWHGACHVDDALQAPANTIHFDGYQQGKLETQFADYQHIPGLNWGGWHDAGDFDLANHTISNTTLTLALAYEEFNPGLDRTTIRRATREVLLHVPDGEDDLLQQVEYGAEGLLGSFRAAGYIFAGIIESTRRQYDVTGDPINITDNLVYDGNLKPDQLADGRSGKRDDRWAFTNRNTGLQYRAAQSLAAASRALRAAKPALSQECLAAAARLWEYEQTNPPVYAPGSYLGRAGRFPWDEINATAELWLTTDDPQYQKRLHALLPQIQSAPAEQVGRGPGWTLVRLLPKLSDPEFRNAILDMARKWKATADAVAASSPYGVRFPSFVLRADWKLDSPEQARGNSMMGVGWDVQSDAMRDYFFHKHLPELFDENVVLNAVNYVLGCHPAANVSYVCGVGAKSQLIAYGFNREDWTHISGGEIPGASFIRPGFLDLKNFPHYYNQTEYGIQQAAAYIFIVLAAQWILEHQRPAAQA